MQSRTMSLVESATGRAIGFAVFTTIQYAIFNEGGWWPEVGLSWPQSIGLTTLFVSASFVINYFVRRAFNALER